MFSSLHKDNLCATAALQVGEKSAEQWLHHSVVTPMGSGCFWIVACAGPWATSSYTTVSKDGEMCIPRRVIVNCVELMQTPCCGMHAMGSPPLTYGVAGCGESRRNKVPSGPSHLLWAFGVLKGQAQSQGSMMGRLALFDWQEVFWGSLSLSLLLFFLFILYK